MIYLLSVGANLIFKYFAMQRINEKIESDDLKMNPKDILTNILAFVPIVNIILSFMYLIILIAPDEILDKCSVITESYDYDKQ